MINRFLALFMIALLTTAASGSTILSANSSNEKKQVSVEEIKEKIKNFGTGEKARVKVELLDKSKFQGYISKTDIETFTVTAVESGFTKEIRYDQVKKIKGYNGSTAKIIAISVVVAIPTFLLLYYIRLRNS
jgi:hypothetical protein